VKGTLRQAERTASKPTQYSSPRVLFLCPHARTHRGEGECKSVITKVTDKLRMRRNPHVCYINYLMSSSALASFPCQLGNETCVTESLALFQDFFLCLMRRSYVRWWDRFSYQKNTHRKLMHWGFLVKEAWISFGPAALSFGSILSAWLKSIIQPEW